MGMGMGFSYTLCHRQVLVCTYCGESVSEHAPFCPQGLVEEVRNLFLHIPCPVCKTGSVEVNSGDFYECRECHTQFTTCAYDDSWKVVWLDSHKLIKALVHPTKGQGEFPIDTLYQEVIKRFEQARRERRKKRS